jgi:glucosylceramidase
VAVTVALLTAVGATSFTAPAASRPRAQRVAVYLTTGDLKSRLARQADLTFRAGTRGGPNAVSVSPAVRYQKLTAGFGVAMTDTAAYELQRQLPARLRNRVMAQLFSPRQGIGLAYLRVPIGGSDYIVKQPYTYDDIPAGQTDPTLAQFSLRHDRAYILPAIRQALKLNPRMTVMANPWSPPAWMKTDDSLIPTGPGITSTLRPGAFAPLARYLVKFLQGYAAAGVPVNQLGVANEPLNTFLTHSFPQMYLSASDEALLIRKYVAPALRRAGLHPRLLGWDYVYPGANNPLSKVSPSGATYIRTVLHNAGRDVKGLAFHCYISDASAGGALHRLHPRLAQFETECSSYLSDITPAQMSIRVLRNWAQGVLLWNAALDQNFGPKVGSGCAGILGPHAGQQCIAPVIVNSKTHRYTLTSDYWALGQFSRFIKLGAQRIASTTPSQCHDGTIPLPACGLEDVTFRNPDGSQVLVATTNDGHPHTLSVNENGRSFSYTIPNGATATFVWPPPVR